MVLYEALAGKTPHGDVDTIGGLIVAILPKPARPIDEVAPHVSRDVAAIVKKALELDPAARYASADAMLADLKRALPEGYAISESMLTGLPESMRHQMESKEFVELADTAASGPLPSATTTAGTAATGPSSIATTSRTPKSRWIIGAAIAAALGVGIIVTVQSLGRDRPRVTTTPLPSATEIATARMLPERVVPSASALPTTTSVLLQIVPPTAEVEVDGQKTAVVNGVVLLAGALGSTHEVRVSLGKRTHPPTTVAVTAQGAVPNRIELSAENPVIPHTTHVASDTAPGINRNFDQQGAPVRGQ